jgi:hypothetical protein
MRGQLKGLERFLPKIFDADLEDDRESGISMSPARRESEVVTSEERVVTAGHNR